VIDLDAAIIVTLVWIIVRLALQLWVAPRRLSGEISARQAAFAYSVALAIAPLLFLPWRHSEGDVLFLSFAAVTIFLGKYAYINYALSRSG
jgi:hypothetical protein